MLLNRLETCALWRLLTLVVLLHSSAVCAQSTLEMQYPPTPPGSQIKDLYPQQFIRFTWTSTWPNTSLYIFQGPNDLGHTARNKLEEGVGPDVTEHAWSAHKLTKKMDRDDPFWLYLFNTNNQSCENCVSNSTRFYMRDKGNDDSLKIGLGVGLGVGIPLVAAIAGLSTWWFIRRRRRQQEGSQRGLLLQDAPMSAQTQAAGPFSPTPGSTAPTIEHVSSVDRKSPIESDRQDVAELPPNAVQIPVEAPVARERVELEGDHVVDRDVEGSDPGRPS